MNFQVSEEQREIKQTVRDFAEKEIAPHVMEWDESAHFPSEIIYKLGRLGLLGAIFPSEYGGAGLGYLEYVSIIEELARVDASVALIVAAHTSLCANHIHLAGTEAQKRRFLAPLARGEKLGCWGLTEPQAGSDAGAALTRARLEGNWWVLDGVKTFITNGTHADLGVIMAVTDERAPKHRCSAFIVERGTAGFRAGKKENKLGMRASDTTELIFEHCRLPRESLLGDRGQGFQDGLGVLEKGRIAIAALAVGLAQGAYEAALAYAKQRRQFGRAIAEFQGIQFKLADMATEIQAARLLTIHAAELAEQSVGVAREGSMAKLYASEVAVKIANDALQIHGGYGFLKDCPAEKYYRDAKLCTIGEGTSEIQRIIIARKLLA